MLMICWWWWWWSRWCLYDDQFNIRFLEWWWWWWWWWWWLLAGGDTIGQELLQWSFPCTNYFLHTDQLYSSLKSFKVFLPSSWGVDFTLQENESTEVQIDWVLHWNCLPKNTNNCNLNRFGMVKIVQHYFSEMFCRNRGRKNQYWWPAEEYW